MAEFNVTGFNNTNDPNTATYDYQEDNDIINLIVDCKLLYYNKLSVEFDMFALLFIYFHFLTVPPVIVSISMIYHMQRHHSSLNVIMLNPLVTIPVTVTNQWSHDGTNGFI